jgi:hypothetical protein
LEKLKETYEMTLLSVSSPNVAGQRLGKHVPATTNTHNNRRTLERGVFYAVYVVSNTQYVGKGKWLFFPELLV